MDTIKDMLASKFGSASEVIHANSEAEAQELKKAHARITELEQAVSDMRRLTLKCAETNELTAQMVQGAIEKLDGNTTPGGNSEEVKAVLEELKGKLDDSFKAQEDVIHKENVRVYRNVQASIVEELKQQSEAIAVQHMHIEKKIKGIKPLAIWALVFAVLSFLAVAGWAVISILGITF